MVKIEKNYEYAFHKYCEGNALNIPIFKLVTENRKIPYRHRMICK